MKEKQSKKIIKQAFEEFENLGACLSGGKDSSVMTKLILDVVKENGYEQPVFLVCDPIPFKESEEFCRKIIKEFGLKRTVFNTQIISEKFLDKARPFGVDRKKCCYWLKVKPMEEFLKKFRIDGLFVAIRHDEHPEREKEGYFSKKSEPVEHTRIHPMLHWTWLDIWEYIKENNLPFNPLYLKGYTSLGCSICTKPVKSDGFKDVDEIIDFVKSGKIKERAGRDLNKEMAMDRLRMLGYY